MSLLYAFALVFYLNRLNPCLSAVNYVKECDGTHSEYCARRVPTLRIKRTSIARSGGNLLRSTV